MGELIKIIGNIKIGDNDLNIELNKGAGCGRKYDIHIQNQRLRVSLSELDFLKVSSSIICASERIKEYKK